MAVCPTKYPPWIISKLLYNTILTENRLRLGANVGFHESTDEKRVHTRATAPATTKIPGLPKN